MIFLQSMTKHYIYSFKDNIGLPLWLNWLKNPPAMRETWVRSLSWEDPLEKGKATHSSILARIVHGVAKSKTRLSNFQ